jgi:dihydroorotate dehydrogenase
MDYSLIKKFLFNLSPEFSHSLTLNLLKQVDDIRLLKKFMPTPLRQPKNLLGLTFENPVGLAAGLDKNGDYIDALGALGFGFIEIGTITPRPQPGNPKPRMFRLESQQAIINRMGFNNKGVDYLIDQVKKKRYQGILGINIGKNADTPLENAVEDYRVCMYKVYPYAHYITINISSPNTPGLRSLQGSDYLDDLLNKLKKEQQRLANEHNKYVPLLIKIAPDLSPKEIMQMATALIENQLDGVIATNTTLDRTLIQGIKYSQEAGGLSGQPLFGKSTDVLKKLRAVLKDNIPIIASGGIITAQQAKDKTLAGADLVQLYTGLIYTGPTLITESIIALASPP